MLEQPRVVYAPRTRPAEKPAAARGAYAILVAKHVALTIGFIVFCLGMIATVWYLIVTPFNASYKVVTLFLACIAASNITGRYALWCINH